MTKVDYEWLQNDDALPTYAETKKTMGETYIQTYTGSKFHFLDPKPDDIFVDDIAHGLSNVCRFGGQGQRFYSVAEHSLLISKWLAEEFGLSDPIVPMWGLLHDASEAYIGDVCRPLKNQLPAYKDIEWHLMLAITKHFGLPWPEPCIVKSVDNRILIDEFEQNMHNTTHTDIPRGIKKLGVRLQFMTPKAAERAFLAQFHRLNERIDNGRAQGRRAEERIQIRGHAGYGGE